MDHSLIWGFYNRSLSTRTKTALIRPHQGLGGQIYKKSDFLNLGNFQQTSLKLAIRTFSNQWGSMSWSWACHRPTMRIISKSPNEIALHFAKGVTRQMSNRRKSRFSVWLGFFLFFFRYQLKIKYVQDKISFLRDLRIQRVFSRWVSHQSKEQLFTLLFKSYDQNNLQCEKRFFIAGV